MEKLRVGFDVDGIHANWAEAFTRVAHSISPKYPVLKDNNEIESWDFKNYFAGAGEVAIDGQIVDMAYVWRRFDSIPGIWKTLNPINASDLEWLAAFQKEYWDVSEVIMVTARYGPILPADEIRKQTVEWYESLGIKDPQVHVRDDKGPAAAELGLDFFVDDHPKNIKSIIDESPDTMPYMLRMRYNTSEANNGLLHLTIDSLSEYHDIVETAARHKRKGM